MLQEVLLEFGELRLEYAGTFAGTFDYNLAPTSAVLLLVEPGAEPVEVGSGVGLVELESR